MHAWNACSFDLKKNRKRTDILAICKDTKGKFLRHGQEGRNEIWQSHLLTLYSSCKLSAAELVGLN